MNIRIKEGDIYSINKPDDLTNTSLSLYSFYILIKIIRRFRRVAWERRILREKAEHNRSAVINKYVYSREIVVFESYKKS